MKAKIMSAKKRLNNDGDKGSPWRRPTFVEKGAPSLLPTLTRYEAFTYISSTILQKLGPSPAMTIFLKRRGRQTLS